MAQHHLPCDEAQPVPVVIATPRVKSIMQAAGFAATSTGGNCMAWRKELSGNGYVLLCAGEAELGEDSDIDAPVWSCTLNDTAGDELASSSDLTLDRALDFIGRGFGGLVEVLFATTPSLPAAKPQTAPPMLYVEKVARELRARAQFKHQALGVLSTGEQIAICLAVGTPAALKWLPRGFQSLPRAWARLDETHRAMVLRVWQSA